MLMIWFERKVISDMQSRIGPNRAGPFGMLQTLADGIKLFFKEDLVPEQADRIVFKLAPYLVILPAFLSFAIVPIGGRVTVAGHTFELQLADPPMGILWLLAMSSISRLRRHAGRLGVGLEVPAARLGAGLGPDDLVRGRPGLDRGDGGPHHRGRCPPGPSSTPRPRALLAAGTPSGSAVVPFLIFMIAVTAETNRPPFDLVEADSELVGGFNTEYSSIRFALFYLAEFMNTITMSAIVVTLFLGGPDGPIPHIPTPSGSGPSCGSWPRPSSSCSSTCGCGPRCPGCATTSSWTWAGSG